MSEQHVVLPGSFRPRQADATRVGAADPASPISITVALSGPPLPDTDHLPAHSLSPAEYAAQYGTPAAEAETVKQVLTGYGLTVDSVSLATRSMEVTGTVAQMEAAFQSPLSIYHSASQGDFRGREGELQIPAALAGLVTGVFGLDQRQVARRSVLAAPPEHTEPRASRLTKAAQKLAPLAPTDLESHYDFPPGDGAGQKIGIAEFGGGYFPDDLATFCAKHGIPEASVTTVAVNLQPLTLDDIKQLPSDQQNEQLDMTGEVMMDVQIVAGLCPKADISVYFATFDQKGWVDLLNRVIQDLPVTLSVSWGLAEDAPDWSAAARAAIVERLTAAALLGITVCVSSGDDGSGTG